MKLFVLVYIKRFLDYNQNNLFFLQMTPIVCSMTVTNLNCILIFNNAKLHVNMIILMHTNVSHDYFISAKFYTILNS